jgi:hypothetical protein
VLILGTISCFCGRKSLVFYYLQQGQKNWADFELPQGLWIAWQGVKVLAATLTPGSQLSTTKKAVSTPADIKGMKILCRGLWADAMKGMNALKARELSLMGEKLCVSLENLE